MTFELLERDGLARLGRLDTPHGPILTPTLLPVVHPDPARQPIAPSEIRRRYGLGAVITSAYITWRSPPLREQAESSGIHALLNFDGPVMTDSGAFQQHAYGHLEVGADAILGFQRRIGSDIVTVLDEFTEPDVDEAAAAKAVETTIGRARAARDLHRGLLAVPVQGGRHADLRNRAAAQASEIGDVLAVGGVVPLFEKYRYPELARALLAARPALAPQLPVHLFGAGHPMVFAFSTLFGVDLFDSSAYLKFARRGDLMFPSGTVALDTLREPFCRCFLCEKMPLPEVAKAPPDERVRRVAEHNLLACAAEVAKVRQAIRDGELWELAERRAAAHPALFAGLRTAIRGLRAFIPTEPETRASFRVIGALSGLRPAAIRFRARVARWKESKGSFRPHPLVPLSPLGLRHSPTETRSGEPIRWEALTGLGPVPVELTELYPVGCFLGPEEFDEGPWRRVPLPADIETGELPVDRDRDWSGAWTERQVASLLEWQYGGEAARTLVAAGLVGDRSPRSGRLRAIRRGPGAPAFVVGVDGVPRPTWPGAELLRSVLPHPQSRIIVQPDAVEFVAAGRSLFSTFVQGGDAGLVPGSSALLVDPDDRLLAVGRLLLAPHEMGRFQRGVAVRVIGHAHSREPQIEESESGPRLGEASAPPDLAPDDS
ncbi:MAG: tRNA guanosine(15) transglycosylase TgtA [Thermoplasmata archaeon]|nr:tRNA guanosine(15) transglycosylase TgtA [Thermoplasmata archaeon]